MITLTPITIKFEHTEKYSLEDYLEYCEDYELTPSQTHYKEWTIKGMVDSITDNIDTNEFTYIYDAPQEIDFELDSDPKEESIPFSFADHVSDLSDEELEDFNKLGKEDKLVINENPYYLDSNIIILNIYNNTSFSYGILHDKGNPLVVKKSENAYYLFNYLKELKDT